jgi:hypothetical protein
MATNDVVLLDSLLEKARPQYAAPDSGELFELFCFDHLLKDFDPSYEDLEDGWTDAGDDGGIDGFFIVLDDIILSDAAVVEADGEEEGVVEPFIFIQDPEQGGKHGYLYSDD